MKRAVLAGFLDTSLPNGVSEVLPEELRTEEFLEWLGVQLGHYRASSLASETMPKLEDEKRHLRAVLARLDEARALFAFEGLPPRLDATAYSCAHAAQVDWIALRRRLHADLGTAFAVLKNAAPKVQAISGKSGRPASHARSEFLKSLVERLRAAPMPAKAALALAERIATLCGIEVPLVKDEDAPRAMRRAVKGHK